jgi:hypothetical protein
VSKKNVRHSTVAAAHPPRRRGQPPRPPRAIRAAPPPKRQVARIIDQSDSSLLDVLDNLLNRGVVLNADIILALADVDLVYIRLSALLCAADRVFSEDAEQ